MAADFTFTPDYSYDIKAKIQKTIINELEDFSEIRRESGNTIGGQYVEKYTMSGQQVQSLLQYFEGKRLATSFTKYGYNPMDRRRR